MGLFTVIWKRVHIAIIAAILSIVFLLIEGFIIFTTTGIDQPLSPFTLFFQSLPGGDNGGLFLSYIFLFNFIPIYFISWLITRKPDPTVKKP